MSCIPAGSVSIYNDGLNYIRFEWTGGMDDGRKDYFRKNAITIQQVDNTNWWIRENRHTVYLQYADVSTDNPTGHRTLPQLISIIMSWTAVSPEEALGAITGYDSTNKLRISCSYNLFNTQFRYDTQPLLFTQLLTGSATVTHNVNYSAVNLATTSGSSDKAVFQTKEYMPYHAGNDIFIIIGALITSNISTTNNIKRWGYFDDVNDKTGTDIGGCGVFFQLNGTTGVISLNWRKFDSGSQVDISVPQAQWNLDTLDNNSISSNHLDLTKSNLFCFKIQVNGGLIMAGVNINGTVTWAHQFYVSNTIAGPTLFNHSLPVRIESKNTGASSSSTTIVYSASVDLEGSSQIPLNPFNYNMNSNASCPVILENVGDHRPLISISLQPLYCRASIWPRSISVNSETGMMCFWRLILNATGLTPTWTNVGFNSYTRYSTNDQTVTIGTDSVILKSGYLSTYDTLNVSDIFENVGLHCDITGTIPDILTLSVEYVRGAAKVRGSISWQESL